jgi:hypothetical protein
MDEEERKRAVAVLERHGYAASDKDSDDTLIAVMDDAVHDAVSAEAAAINNAGPADQIEYLEGIVKSIARKELDPEPTHYVAKFELSFFEYDQPDFGGRVDTTSGETVHESVYSYVQELINDDSLPFKFGPMSEATQKTAKELRDMAAAIEAPDDMREEDMAEMHSKVIEYLLAMAGTEEP